MVNKIRKTWIVVGLAVVATVLLGWRLIGGGGKVVVTPLSVVSVKPEPGAEGVSLNPEFQLIFNQEVTASELTVTVEPETKYEVVQVESKVVNFSPTLPLKPATKYEMTVKRGELVVKQWGFTTKKAQGDPTIFSEIEKFQEENYPWRGIIPHIEADFEIYYLGPKELKIFLKGETIGDSRAKALKWIIDQEGDPTTHKITYETK